jgi:hypothetical protein
MAVFFLNLVKYIEKAYHTSRDFHIHILIESRSQFDATWPPIGDENAPLFSCWI